MTIKLNAQVTTRGANTFEDDNFNLEIKELQSEVDDYLNKAVEIRKNIHLATIVKLERFVKYVR